MKRIGQNLFLTALVVSLFLHFGTGLVVWVKGHPAKKSESIEVQIVDKNKMEEYEKLAKQMTKNEARQIVEQSAKAVNDEIDEKAKYLSMHNQKVVTETRAANVGRFQNDAHQGQAKQSQKTEMNRQPQPETNQKVTKREKIKDILTDDNGQVARHKLSNKLKPQFQWDKFNVGVQDPGLVSQSDDHIKDAQIGPQTLLSTREFIYYSYYARIKDRLRLFWEPKIKEKVNRLFMAGRHLASNDEKVTKLVITLDQKGKLIRVQVMSESGLKDLDDAAVEAFQQAAPFPNPPKGIVDADGTIKIRWDFILEAGMRCLVDCDGEFA